MKTVKLYFKRSNDTAFYRSDYWSLSDRESEHTWISESTVFVVPDDLEISETVGGDLCFFRVGYPDDFGFIDTKPNREPRVCFAWCFYDLDRLDALKDEGAKS